MAIIECPRCKKEINDVLDRCIFCGCRHGEWREKQAGRKSRGEKTPALDWFKLVIVFLVVAAFLALFGKDLFFILRPAAEPLLNMIKGVFSVIFNL